MNMIEFYDPLSDLVEPQIMSMLRKVTVLSYCIKGDNPSIDDMVFWDKTP